MVGVMAPDQCHDTAVPLRGAPVAGPGQRRGPAGPEPGATITWPSPRELARRLPRLLFGLGLIAVGLTLMVRARMGLAPYEVLHQGISLHTPLKIGQAGVVVGLVVMVAWFPLGQRPGLGTVVNVLGVGIALDLLLAVVGEPSALWVRAVWAVAGVVLIGIGVGMYIGAGLGPGPRDGLMTGLARRGLRVWAVRLVMEVTALVGGWLLGGTVGVGTVLVAVGLPMVVDRSIRLFALPIRPISPVETS